MGDAEHFFSLNQRLALQIVKTNIHQGWKTEMYFPLNLCVAVSQLH